MTQKSPRNSPRSGARPKAAEVPADTDLEPIDFDSRPTPEDEDRTPLFTLDGHVYTIPTKPSAGFVLRYLRAVKTGVSSEAAAADLLEDMIGEEAYAAMAVSPKIKLEDFAQIMNIVKAKTLGPALEALGN